MWYDEIKDYDFNKPGFSMATGHFTQVVWKSSSALGCGIAMGAKNGVNWVYGVGQYTPPGNVIDNFSENVLPK